MKKPFHGSPLKVLEADVFRSIRYILELLQTNGLLQYWRVNTGPSLRRTGIFTPNKDTAGFSDLLILITDGPTIFAEIKSPTGKQSKKQKEFERRIKLTKGDRYYFIWKSVEDARRDLSPFVLF